MDHASFNEVFGPLRLNYHSRSNYPSDHLSGPAPGTRLSSSANPTFPIWAAACVEALHIYCGDMILGPYERSHSLIEGVSRPFDRIRDGIRTNDKGCYGVQGNLMD